MFQCSRDWFRKENNVPRKLSPHSLSSYTKMKFFIYLLFLIVFIFNFSWIHQFVGISNLLIIIIGDESIVPWHTSNIWVLRNLDNDKIIYSFWLHKRWNGFEMTPLNVFCYLIEKTSLNQNRCVGNGTITPLQRALLPLYEWEGKRIFQIILKDVFCNFVYWIAMIRSPKNIENNCQKSTLSFTNFLARKFRKKLATLNFCNSKMN